MRSLREGSFDAVTLDLFMPGMSGFEVLRAMRADPALRQTPVVVVSVLSGREVLAGEWSVSKPIDSEELADALGGAVLAGRTRALIVGREELRTRLVPALAGLNIDYRWVESAAAAAVACDQERFEIALVDAGTARPQAVLEALDLRGRRLGKGILLFSNGDDAPGLGKLETEPVRIDEVANAIVDVLSGRPSQ